jgi:hypothetical protein
MELPYVLDERYDTIPNLRPAILHIDAARCAKTFTPGLLSAAREKTMNLREEKQKTEDLLDMLSKTGLLDFEDVIVIIIIYLFFYLYFATQNCVQMLFTSAATNYLSLKQKSLFFSLIDLLGGSTCDRECLVFLQ